MSVSVSTLPLSNGVLSPMIKKTRVSGPETIDAARVHSMCLRLFLQLFRKDLISAMKLGDSEQLPPHSYLMISDSWRQEWERGVQIPVNPDELPQPAARLVTTALTQRCDFRLPKKLLRAANGGDDDAATYGGGTHVSHTLDERAERTCRYDLDDIDLFWLDRVNDDRRASGGNPIVEAPMEQIIEELEVQSHMSLERAMRYEEGLGIEYDDDTICTVCRSPDYEEGNEMVFCDGCDIAVHQACYGIQVIPPGDWLCRCCALGIRPQCMFCPQRGGAMKPTKSGTKWAHVSCALWIPEVRIGSPELMEPITDIAAIPASRWDLVCCVCQEKVGACIQCTVKSCKKAFHVTCGFTANLRMEQKLSDEPGEQGSTYWCGWAGYCARHVITPRKKQDSAKRSPTKKETANERNARIYRVQQEFYKNTSIRSIASNLQADDADVDLICQYWKLKRTSEFTRPLLTPKKYEEDLLLKQEEDSLCERLKMLIYVRQDLERVRNLCYMVERREKLKRNWYRMREDVFLMQQGALTRFNRLSEFTIKLLVAASHDRSIYDRALLVGRGAPTSYKSWQHTCGRKPGAAGTTKTPGRRGRPRTASPQLCRRPIKPEELPPSDNASSTETPRVDDLETGRSVDETPGVGDAQRSCDDAEPHPARNGAKRRTSFTKGRRRKYQRRARRRVQSADDASVDVDAVRSDLAPSEPPGAGEHVIRESRSTRSLINFQRNNPDQSVDESPSKTAVRANNKRFHAADFDEEAVSRLGVGVRELDAASRSSDGDTRCGPGDFALDTVEHDHGSRQRALPSRHSRRGLPEMRNEPTTTVAVRGCRANTLAAARARYCCVPPGGAVPGPAGGAHLRASSTNQRKQRGILDEGRGDSTSACTSTDGQRLPAEDAAPSVVVMATKRLVGRPSRRHLIARPVSVDAQPRRRRGCNDQLVPRAKRRRLDGNANPAVVTRGSTGRLKEEAAAGGGGSRPNMVATLKKTTGKSRRDAEQKTSPRQTAPPGELVNHARVLATASVRRSPRIHLVSVDVRDAGALNGPTPHVRRLFLDDTSKRRDLGKRDSTVIAAGGGNPSTRRAYSLRAGVSQSGSGAAGTSYDAATAERGSVHGGKDGRTSSSRDTQLTDSPATTDEQEESPPDATREEAAGEQAPPGGGTPSAAAHGGEGGARQDDDR
ncbi:PREDICTED: protein Jade-1-like [Priapulus caudatus]|uniref:Protein Jade-1-like n=1 Tax=Priapulus caudatus TaxID=37621 RepID=A0ABM1E4F4_PRICU|nr:PREDICTED: protein Jade-1-like [Priapulus caudatus]